MTPPTPGLTLEFIAFLVFAISGAILSTAWLVFPLLLLSKLSKIHDTLLRIERKGGSAKDNPFDV